MLPCAPRARWPQIQLGALCLGAISPCPDGSCPALEECLVRGWHGALLAVRVTQIPILVLACSGSTSCSLGLYLRSRAGTSFSRMEAREEGCWCVDPLISPSPGTGVGEEGVRAALQALLSFSLLCFKLPSWVQPCSGHAQQDSRHSGQVTRSGITRMEDFPEKLPIQIGPGGQLLKRH